MQRYHELLEKIISTQAKALNLPNNPYTVLNAEYLEPNIKHQIAFLLEQTQPVFVQGDVDDEAHKAIYTRHLVDYHQHLPMRRETFLFALRDYHDKLIPVGDIYPDIHYEELIQRIYYTPKDALEARDVLNQYIRTSYQQGKISFTEYLTLLIYGIKSDYFTVERCQLFASECYYLLYQYKDTSRLITLEDLLAKLEVTLPIYPRETSSVLRHFLSMGDELGYWVCPEGLETDVEADITVTALLLAIKYGYTDIATTYPEHGYIAIEKLLEASDYKGILSILQSENDLSPEDEDIIHDLLKPL